MKKYQTFYELERNQTTKQQLDELRIFQYLLRNNARLNDRFQNKGIEIADSLQLWIDALEISLDQ